MENVKYLELSLLGNGIQYIYEIVDWLRVYTAAASNLIHIKALRLQAFLPPKQEPHLIAD